MKKEIILGQRSLTGSEERSFNKAFAWEETGMCRRRRSTRLDETVSIDAEELQKPGSSRRNDDAPRKKKKRKFRHWDAPKRTKKRAVVSGTDNIDIKEHKARARDFSASLTPLEELEMQTDNIELEKQAEARRPLFPPRPDVSTHDKVADTPIIPLSKNVRTLLPTPSQSPHPPLRQTPSRSPSPIFVRASISTPSSSRASIAAVASFPPCLQPFQALLQKAGNANIAQLRLFIKKEYIDEYIAMLRETFPGQVGVADPTQIFSLRMALLESLG